MWENVFLLVLTGAVKIGFTAWTFGMMVRFFLMSPGNIRDRSQVPAGIFLPTIAIGAAFGRAVGLLTCVLILLRESVCFDGDLARVCIGRTPKLGCSLPVHPIQQFAASILASTQLLALHR
jgi:hypothetical protein